MDSLSKHIAHMLPTHRSPTPPGEMLLRQFMEPGGLTQAELARRIGVSYPRVNELVNGKRSLTPDTALRLARLFGVSVEFWMTTQMLWDMWHVIHSPTAADIEKIEPMWPELDDDDLADFDEFGAVPEQSAAD
ncbi:MAG TPA: HigA family addiction module antitoxin [Longimicrobium sp.]|nr:HigA family addiction module antitoxin [Longimicrobium sp.]